jgi:uncharacterized protein (TIGR02246 family)
MADNSTMKDAIVAREDAGSLLRAYWAAEEARDVDAILDCFTDDAAFVDRFGRVTSGRGALRAFYEASAGAFPQVEVRLVRLIGGPSPMAVQYEATLVDLEGTARHARVVVIAHIRDNRFERLESYFDGAALAG